MEIMGSEFLRGRRKIGGVGAISCLAEQDNGATWTLFLAGSAIARHPPRGQSPGDFFAEDSYACYHDRLAAAAAEYGCAIHAYVLMTNHVYLAIKSDPVYP
jgi:hypothetical protein